MLILSDPRIQLASTIFDAAAALLTTAQAKSALRITSSTEDTQVDAWVAAATRKVEEDTGLLLLDQTRDFTGDRFPEGRSSLAFPHAPLSAVTHVKYYDSDGTLQTLATSNYIVDTTSKPGAIGLTDAGAWPTDLREFRPLSMRAVFGWATADDVPADLVEAVKLVVGTLSESRQMTDVEGRLYEWFIAPHRLHALA